MKMRIRVDGVAHEVEAEPVEGGVRVTVNGVTYRVEVEPLSPAATVASSVGVPRVPASAPPDLPTPISAKPTSDRNVIAPLAGVIKQVLVRVGESLTTNQAVLVMEAMKMETTIYAPAAGVVQAIHCQPGDAVMADRVLVEVV